jgi:hypothetical protein
MSLLNLPEYLQQQIESLASKPSQNQLTEKHTRALLLLNKNPEEQEKLYKQITTGDNISRDEAMIFAKEMKGQSTTRILKISYSTKEELIRKLEVILKELKGDTQEIPF